MPFDTIVFCQSMCVTSFLVSLLASTSDVRGLDGLDKGKVTTRAFIPVLLKHVDAFYYMQYKFHRQPDYAWAVYGTNCIRPYFQYSHNNNFSTELKVFRGSSNYICIFHSAFAEANRCRHRTRCALTLLICCYQCVSNADYDGNDQLFIVNNASSPYWRICKVKKRK